MNVELLINRSQLEVMYSGLNGEEHQWWRAKFKELDELAENLPKLYSQEGKGEDAIVHLHYFSGGADWWITEVGEDGDTAFGLADIFRDGGELGYISLSELRDNGVEFDLHWEPKTLREVRNGR